MFDALPNMLWTVAVYAVPAILAITLHEAAHGFAARLCGDMTATRLGRVTLNPIAHVDPVGTLLIPGFLLLGSLVSGTSGVLFGWAKPVPVNARNFASPRRDMVLVAAAGPLSNLVQAFLWAGLLRLVAETGITQDVFERCLQFAWAGISVNVFLMAFNLLPLLPLDGGRVLAGLLPAELSWKFAQLERWGMPIMVVLIASGALSYLLRPVTQIAQEILRFFF